jgi:hypothetical protein
MKVEKTHVHRLSVERECGCRAVREFKDQQYKDAIAEAIYSPCKKHKASKELTDMMGMILCEDVNREAESMAAVPVHLHPIPVATTTTLDGSSGETVTSMPIARRRPQVHVAPASGGGSGAPAPQNGPRRDPTQVRTISRDHAVGRRATAAGRTPVTGVTVTNPAGARRPNTVQVGEVELETPGMDILDMDGVEEDPRVTRLAEDALLPDLEDDPSQA